MEPILPALGLGGAFVAGYLYNRWRIRYWEGIAADRGVQVVQRSGWAWNWTLHGQTGKLKVRISGSLGNKNGTQIVVVIPGPPGFSEVSIRREYQAPWKTHEVEIGSRFFDPKFCVQGPEQLVLSILDAETRGLLVSVNDMLTTVGSRLEITGGELLVETVDLQLSHLLPLLLRVGESLARPLDVEENLTRNATQDPEAGVRLRAAVALGAQGRGVLLGLTENLEDDAVSAQAVSFLERELPFESTKAILLRALSSRRPQTAGACLEALARGGDASAFNLLVEVMEKQPGEVAAFAARALAITGSPAAEEPLIRALQRGPAGLRVAAAKALGRVGSMAAVLPLKKAIGRWEPELSRAALQAIADIHSRIPGASPGQLSLAGAEAGQLSLAQAEAGQLSIATDTAGQLSISNTKDKQKEPLS